MIVADASVLVAALLDEGSAGALARERLLAHDVHVPELADVEVLSAVRRRVLSGAVASERGAGALQDYAELILGRFPHLPLLARAWQLRDGVSAYDAIYVALAEVLEVPLVTADRRLSRAPGLRCEIDLLQ
ncbi:Predicted nucleic acid-binding protein, contains PIN domain [Modestobacter sp. DSM 44400]|uniref:type II toxin-antitoxin system VapC family toxin n=1 Tax=Modestobacter sp. DSM 44400 TaxID=1550230 RepID=UPI00089C373E|nr:type II toxin-antitoxin system VapC family toxin [Modestobacter sp. DSM 44400]SDX66504.1 Predicted nucleic acid-binding protein, contains PIN domain [Modestobacter sp. DSM 44400]